MKVHQLFAFLAIMLIGVAAPAFGGQKKAFDFVGITWAGCKKSVSSSLAKLEGVTAVKITAGEKAKTQVVILELEDDAKAPTKEQVVKALGKTAKRFVCKGEKKAKEEKKDS